MNNLLCIPSDLFRIQVWPFLRMKDAVMLDSALLTRNIRTQYMETIQNTDLTSTVMPIKQSILTWLSNRSLKIQFAKFCGDLCDADLIVNIGAMSKTSHTIICGCQEVTDLGLFTLLQESASLQSLEIHYCFQISHNHLRDVRAPMLRELRIIDCHTLNDATFTELVVNCPNLEHIDISGCYELSDISVRILTLICSKLQSFKFRDSRRITIDSILYLSQNCSHLRKVEGDYQLGVQFNALVAQSPQYFNILDNLARHNPSLELLQIELPYSTDEQIMLFAQNCPNLHTCSLGANIALSHVGVGALAELCSQLGTLSLQYVENVDTQCLEAIGRHCSALTSLALPYSDSTSAEDVAALCKIWAANPRLHSLILEGVAYFTSEACESMSLCCPNLTHLDISEINSFSEGSLISALTDCTKLTHVNMSLNTITPAILGALGRHCPKLHTLVLMQSRGVDSPALLALAAHCTSLTHLKINRCSATDEGLVAIVSQCMGLEFLDLCWSGNLHDASILAIAAHCKHLQTLKLGNSRVSTQAFQTLVRSCTKMRKFSLRCCKLVTDECVALIALNCPDLEDLCLTENSLITEASLLSLSQHSRCLRQVNFENCVGIVEGEVAATMRSQYKGQLSLKVGTLAWFAYLG